MKRCLWLALLPCLARPTIALAQEQPRQRVTLFTGTRLLFNNSSTLHIDGKKKESEGADFGIAFDAGARVRVVSVLGLELRGSVGTYSTSWASSREETRDRLDLALGPVLSGTWHFQRPFVGWRVGLPVGPSWARFKSGPARGVEDRYGTGHGINAALIGGVDLFGRHHGGYFEAGVASSWLSIGHEARLKSDAAVSVREQYRYVEVGIFLACGYAVRF